jgi:hypothetical protein
MSLSRRYKSIVSIIEETRDLDVLRAEEALLLLKYMIRGRIYMMIGIG